MTGEDAAGQRQPAQRQQQPAQQQQQPTQQTEQPALQQQQQSAQQRQQPAQHSEQPARQQQQSAQQQQQQSAQQRQQPAQHSEQPAQQRQPPQQPQQLPSQPLQSGQEPPVQQQQGPYAPPVVSGPAARICRDFNSGGCERGTECRFRHVKCLAGVPACWKHAHGACIRGTACVFRHVARCKDALRCVDPRCLAAHPPQLQHAKTEQASWASWPVGRDRAGGGMQEPPPSNPPFVPKPGASTVPTWAGQWRGKGAVGTEQRPAPTKSAAAKMAPAKAEPAKAAPSKAEKRAAKVEAEWGGPDGLDPKAVWRAGYPLDEGDALSARVDLEVWENATRLLVDAERSQWLRWAWRRMKEAQPTGVVEELQACLQCGMVFLSVGDREVHAGVHFRKFETEVYHGFTKASRKGASFLAKEEEAEARSLCLLWAQEAACIRGGELLREQEALLAKLAEENPPPALDMEVEACHAPTQTHTGSDEDAEPARPAPDASAATRPAATAGAEQASGGRPGDPAPGGGAAPPPPDTAPSLAGGDPREDARSEAPNVGSVPPGGDADERGDDGGAEHSAGGAAKKSRKTEETAMQDTEGTGPDQPLPFSYEDIATRAIPKLERVPTQVQLVVAAQLAKALQGAASGSATGWLRLYSFPALVLCKCPRGGNKAVIRTLKRRCHLWADGKFGQLWAEASEIAKGPGGKKTDQKRFAVESEEGRQVVIGLGLSTDVEDACELDAKTVGEAIRLAKARRFGRAVATLSAAKVASVTPESIAGMVERHLSALPPEMPSDSDIQGADVPEITKGAVVTMLRAMPRGTAAGPSGLSAQNLLDLLGPASPALEPLIGVIRRIATGVVPTEARPFMFGAKLVALEKKCGGLRPIACGEILRRLAAKVLAGDKTTKDLAKRVLASVGQTGVGMKSGADTMIACMRMVGNAYMAQGSGRGFVKIDLKNAFNLVSRTAILKAVRDLAPSLLPYAVAAYGSGSRLSFGHAAIWSECGVQQGDPLGPLFFCLVLKQVLDRVDKAMEEPAAVPDEGMDVDAPAPDDRPRVEARSFYLDDGAIAGPWAALIEWLGHFEREGAVSGMHLNRAKSEVATCPGESAPDTFKDMSPLSLDNWEVLGAPCGSMENVKAAVEKALGKTEKRSKAIASLPDPHVALSLLKSCAGFSCVVSLMRATGPIDGTYARVDRITREALSRVTGIEVSDRTWAQASLPVRLGGLGLQSCEDTAAIAGVAATLDGRRGARALMTDELWQQACAAQDPLVAAAVECRRLAQHPDVRTKVEDALRAETDHKPRQQKVWGTEIALGRRAAFLGDPQTDDRTKARLQSCSAQHASSWLYGTPDAPATMWLSGMEFNVLVRQRLGLAVTAEERMCRLCDKNVADVFGDHSLTCMNVGLRTRAHTALRDEVAKLAREALLTPAVEAAPFSGEGFKGLRLDVMYQREERARMIDVAITFPLQPRRLKHAVEDPGGAATKYEDVKRRKYEEAVRTEQRLLRGILVPMVVDTFGAWGESARPELKAIVIALHRRHDWEPFSAVSQKAYHRLSFVMARSVARLLLANASVHLDAEAAAAETAEEGQLDEPPPPTEHEPEPEEEPFEAEAAEEPGLAPPPTRRRSQWPPVQRQQRAAGEVIDVDLDASSSSSGSSGSSDSDSSSSEPSGLTSGRGPKGQEASRSGCAGGAPGSLEAGGTTEPPGYQANPPGTTHTNTGKDAAGKGRKGGKGKGSGAAAQPARPPTNATQAGARGTRALRVAGGEGSLQLDAPEGGGRFGPVPGAVIGAPSGRADAWEGGLGNRPPHGIAAAPKGCKGKGVNPAPVDSRGKTHPSTGKEGRGGGLGKAGAKARGGREEFVRETAVPPNTSNAVDPLPVGGGALVVVPLASELAVALPQSHGQKRGRDEARLDAGRQRRVKAPGGVKSGGEKGTLVTVPSPSDLGVNVADMNVADVFGEHSLTCMNVGLRTRAHTALRDEVAKLAREALLTPAVEAAPFSGEGFKGLRLDVMYQREERARMIDVAITFPLQPRRLKHAVEDPGGAATKYEDVKRRKYKEANVADKNVADVFGEHSLTCMNVGLRTRAHTALRDEVAKLAREALLTPAVEAAPFSGEGFKGLRLDVMYQRGERARMIDVAITFPLQPRRLKHAVENPGGAATKYEDVKRRKYKEAVRTEQRLLRGILVPMVVDTFGAWGESARPELKAIVIALHRRHDWEPFSAVSQKAYHRLSFVMARSVARLLLANASVHLDADTAEEGQLDEPPPPTEHEHEPGPKKGTAGDPGDRTARSSGGGPATEDPGPPKTHHPNTPAHTPHVHPRQAMRGGNGFRSLSEGSPASSERVTKGHHLSQANKLQAEHVAASVQRTGLARTPSRARPVTDTARLASDHGDPPGRR
ncbi:Retrotransposable element SLACS 132 kDa protein [Diplonema papillatum]|nr:Retrotransposable element SLACS 132 kDa protein [Diplonema papillatum]